MSGWGEWLVLEVLLYQIPLSFKGAGFIDIGLTRLLWLGLLIETNTSCLTLSTFLSEKVSFFKKRAEGIFVAMISSPLLSCC